MTDNFNAILAVETWNEETGSGERLRLEVDPQRLVALANSTNPSPTEVSELMQVLVWKISLNWLSKLKLNPGHRFKGSRRLVDPLKPFGVLLCSALNLTEYLSAYQVYRPNQSALEVFASLAIDLFTLCHAMPDGKEAKIKELRLIVKGLRNNEQPFNQQQYPTLFGWWEAVRSRACNDRDPNFSGKYLFRTSKTNPSEAGLIPAFTGWIEALHKNEPLVAVKADLKHLSFQEGGGRPVKVKPELLKNEVVSGILAPQRFQAVISIHPFPENALMINPRVKNTTTIRYICPITS